MDDAPTTLLCKSCGLCCDGRLFIWVKLRPAELDPAESLGMRVFRSDPSQRGFSQPCPLWNGQCSIYTSRHYPHACRAYKCKLFKELAVGNITPQTAFEQVAGAKRLIGEVELLLPPSQNPNFRERVVGLIEHPEFFAGLIHTDFPPRAKALLECYESVFGVNDLLEKPIER